MTRKERCGHPCPNLGPQVLSFERVGWLACQVMAAFEQRKQQEQEQRQAQAQAQAAREKQEEEEARAGRAAALAAAKAEAVVSRTRRC